MAVYWAPFGSCKNCFLYLYPDMTDIGDQDCSLLSANNASASTSSNVQHLSNNNSYISQYRLGPDEFLPKKGNLLKTTQRSSKQSSRAEYKATTPELIEFAVWRPLVNTSFLQFLVSTRMYFTNKLHF